MSEQAENELIEAAIAWRGEIGQLFANSRLSQAVDRLLAERRDDECLCARDRKEYCHSSKCHGGDDVPVWATATWADVREGDVVRMPGVEATAARASELGPVCGWHVDPASPPRFPAGGEWSNRMVTLTPLAGGEPMRPPNGMNPAAPVEIRTTAAELAAIEALGGWAARL